MGVVTAHIVEEGPDVRVSFSGTLSIDPNLADVGNPSSNPTPMFIVSGTSLLIASGQSLNDNGLGVPANTTMPVIVGNPSIAGSNAFGYNSGQLFYAESDITGGSVGSVSQITVDPSDSFFVIANTTLPSVLGSLLMSGSTLWTATTTNDTIVLSTSPPDGVPEPSSVILCFFAGIGLLRRKR